MPTYIKYQLENGGELLVEAPERPPSSSVTFAANPPDAEGNLILTAQRKFTEALGGVKQSALMVVKELDELKVEEMEIKFGLKTTGEAGLFAVGKLGAEANYEVTLKWKRTEKP